MRSLLIPDLVFSNSHEGTGLDFVSKTLPQRELLLFHNNDNDQVSKLHNISGYHDQLKVIASSQAFLNQQNATLGCFQKRSPADGNSHAC